MARTRKKIAIDPQIIADCLDSEYNYLTCDEQGCWHAHEKKPKLIDDGQWESDNCHEMTEGMLAMYTGKLPKKAKDRIWKKRSAKEPRIIYKTIE